MADRVRQRAKKKSFERSGLMLTSIEPDSAATTTVASNEEETVGKEIVSISQHFSCYSLLNSPLLHHLPRTKISDPISTQKAFSIRQKP